MQGRLSAAGSTAASFSCSVPSLHNDINPGFMLTDLSFNMG